MQNVKSQFYNPNPAPLGANAVFTSPVFDAGAAPGETCGFANIAVAVRTDQAGLSPISLQVQQSHDGVTWFYVIGVVVPAATSLAQGPTSVNTPIYARYTRAIYTNGTVAQTSFWFGARFN